MNGGRHKLQGAAIRDPDRTVSPANDSETSRMRQVSAAVPDHECTRDDLVLIFASSLGLIGRAGVSLITQPKNAA